MIRPTIETEAGTEVQCAKCGDWWPADKEFFYITNGRPHSWCRACYVADPKVVAKSKRYTEKISARRAEARGVTA